MARQKFRNVLHKKLTEPESYEEDKRRVEKEVRFFPSDVPNASMSRKARKSWAQHRQWICCVFESSLESDMETSYLQKRSLAEANRCAELHLAVTLNCCRGLWRVGGDESAQNRTRTDRCRFKVGWLATPIFWRTTTTSVFRALPGLLLIWQIGRFITRSPSQTRAGMTVTWFERKSELKPRRKMMKGSRDGEAKDENLWA